MSVTISLTSEYLLDESALRKIFISGESLGAKNLLGNLIPVTMTDEELSNYFDLCFYTHNLIRTISEMRDEGEEASVLFRDRLSKTRSEMYFFKTKIGTVPLWPEPSNKPEGLIHYRWQFYLTIDKIVKAYPFLTFYQEDEDLEEIGYDESEEDNWTYLVDTLEDGSKLIGENFSNEIGDYHLRTKLNSLGDTLVTWIKRMYAANILEPSDDIEGMSVAYWHRKET